MLFKRRKIKLISILCATALLLSTILAMYGCSSNQIRYTVNDTLPDGEGKVARVILLGGQSNASGCSRDDYLEKNVSEEKYAEYKNGYDNVYINYLSGQNLSEGFVKCATEQGEIGDGFGPELGLADKLNELYPDETFFIIKCAWGGTNLFEQWLSPSSKGKTGDLYKSFVAFVQSSIDYLTDKGYDVQIEGMCWMQGESDSFSVEASNAYGEHLENFIKDIRGKFSKYAAADGIAFIDAYIAKNPAYWVYYEAVNQGKTDVASLSELNRVVDTSDLSCTLEPEGAPDIAHYDSLSEIKLGHLFALELVPYLA